MVSQLWPVLVYFSCRSSQWSPPHVAYLSQQLPYLHTYLYAHAFLFLPGGTLPVKTRPLDLLINLGTSQNPMPSAFSLFPYAISKTLRLTLPGFSPTPSLHIPSPRQSIHSPALPSALNKCSHIFTCTISGDSAIHRGSQAH